jgi:hypothetical protein
MNEYGGITGSNLTAGAFTDHLGTAPDDGLRLLDDNQVGLADKGMGLTHQRTITPKAMLGSGPYQSVAEKRLGGSLAPGVTGGQAMPYAEALLAWQAGVDVRRD